MGNVISDASSMTWKYRGGGIFGSAPASGGFDIEDIGSNQYRLTISSGFGTKPNGQTSKVLWDADLGVDGFHATLSRDQAWQSAALGAVSTVHVSAGATQSVRYDLAGKGAVLAEHTLDTAPEKIIMYRHRYDDFSMSEDWVVRTRVTGVDVFPSIGSTVTGGTSGATAIVQSVEDSGGGVGTIFYNSTDGTVNNEGGAKFSSGENQTWTAGSGTNNEGAGMLISFNNKCARFWNGRSASGQHDCYFSESSDGPDNPALQGRKQNAVEGVGATQSIYDNGPVLQKNAANEWVNDLFFIKNSTIDVADGKTIWWKQAQKSFDADDRILQSVAPADGWLDEVVQHQVSNGCQPNSFAYYSALIIDDSWYFVTAWNTARTKFQVLPVVSWSDTEIIVEDLGRELWDELDVHIDSLTPAYNGGKP